MEIFHNWVSSCRVSEVSPHHLETSSGAEKQDLEDVLGILDYLLHHLWLLIRKFC